MISALISATMCMTAFTVNANAENNKLQFENEVYTENLSSEASEMENIKIVTRNFDKNTINENWDRFTNECERNGSSLHPDIARGDSAPTSLHRLDISNLSFAYSISDGSGARLYTDYYFVSNDEGIIWLEGSAQIHEYTNQTIKIYLYDKTTGTVGSVKLDDSQVAYEENGVRKRFYYNFGFINLNTSHEYYIGFGLSAMAANYDVWGIISHDGTNEIEH